MQACRSVVSGCFRPSRFRLSSSMSAVSGKYLYRSITPQDSEAVRQMYCEFWRRESIAAALKMDVPRECEKYTEFALKEVLCNKVSVVAEDKHTGKLVGMITFVVATPENPQQWVYPADNPDCHTMIQLQRILGKVYTCPDYFKQYNVDKYLLSRGTVVFEEHGRQGVCLNLLDKSFQISSDLGIRLFVIDCMSPYSRRILDKNDFTQVSRIDLADYKEEESLFLPQDSPKLVTLHILEL